MTHHEQSSRFSADWTKVSLIVSLSVFLLYHVDAAPSTHYSASVSSDMSKPTYGLQGATSSSIGYNSQDGLAIKGQLGDILGPPIKIASGIGNIVTGSALSGLGTSVSSGSAILGKDANLLQAFGQAEKLKGGAMYGGAVAKTAGATVLGGLPGGIVSGVVNAPMKFMGVKDMKVGKEMMAKGREEADIAQRYHQKAQNLILTGDNMKYNGINQVLTGATEGLTGVGNAVQSSANTAAAGLRFLPIIFEIPDPTYPAGDQQGPRGVSFISGLNSLLPGLNEGLGKQDGRRPAMFNMTNNPFQNLFGLPTEQFFSTLLGANGVQLDPANQHAQQPQQVQPQQVQPQQVQPQQVQQQQAQQQQAQQVVATPGQTPETANNGSPVQTA